MEWDETSTLVTIAEFVCYMFHFAFGYLFVKKMMSVSLMHPNLRLLMCNIIIEYTLTGAARISDYMVVTFVPDERTNITLCFCLRVVQDTSILVNGTTFVWISLERLMATLLIRSYERKTSLVGWRILQFAYAQSFMIALSGAVYDYMETEGFKSVDSCQTSHVHPTLLPAFAAMAMVAYLFVLTLMISLYRYNLKMKSTAHWMPLSARYQYGENVATLSVLVPSVAIWGIVLFACTPLLIWYHSAWQSQDRDTQLLINRIIYLMAAINSIVCPVAFVVKYEPLRKAFGSFGCKPQPKRSSTVCPVWETDAHFQYLQDHWQTVRK